MTEMYITSEDYSVAELDRIEKLKRTVSSDIWLPLWLDYVVQLLLLEWEVKD